MSADLDNNQSVVPTNPVSRRDFLKIAGVAGAALGMGAGLGGVLAACGEEETTTTTAGSTTTTAAATTTTAGATTTVSAEAEVGREIKIGWAIPVTGALAGFAIPSEFIIKEFQDNVWKDGMVLGDGKKHPINCIVADTQSDTNRASQVAGDLLNNTKVDIIGANGADDTVDPVAVQAETLGVPCLTCGSPNNGWYKALGNPTPGPKWCYHFCFTNDQFGHAFVGMWDTMPTNKKVAWLMLNSAAGINYNDPEGPRPPIEEAGYEIVDTGYFEFGTSDYSAEISAYKKAGCDILMAVIFPPDSSRIDPALLEAGGGDQLVERGAGVAPLVEDGPRPCSRIRCRVTRPSGAASPVGRSRGGRVGHGGLRVEAGRAGSGWTADRIEKTERSV